MEPSRAINVGCPHLSAHQPTMMNGLYMSIVSMQALKCKVRDAAAVGMFTIKSSTRIGNAMTFVFL